VRELVHRCNKSLELSEIAPPARLVISCEIKSSLNIEKQIALNALAGVKGIS
jgi:hypothetical protein